MRHKDSLVWTSVHARINKGALPDPGTAGSSIQPQTLQLLCVFDALSCRDLALLSYSVSLTPSTISATPCLRPRPPLPHNLHPELFKTYSLASLHSRCDRRRRLSHSSYTRQVKASCVKSTLFRSVQRRPRSLRHTTRLHAPRYSASFHRVRFSGLPPLSPNAYSEYPASYALLRGSCTHGRQTEETSVR